jgi:gamma-glutamyl:cysteine ligase YbdK (ATP-grasp superfamily)
MRALPAGPTTVDMLANTAFLVGLSLGLAPQVDALTGALPFEQARQNFYRAAQSGLDAEIAWPDGPGGGVQSECAERLIPRLLPVARSGLTEAGVETDEIDELLAVISERCARRKTGAAWQRRVLSDLDAQLERRRALALMLERYLGHSESGEPVHTWPFDR